MASTPQAENGHIDIAHPIAEKLMTFSLTGHESQILWAVFRKTYGWKKKSDRIPLSQFAEMTGMVRQRAVEAVGGLVRKNVLLCSKDSHGNVYSLNKELSEWKEIASTENRARLARKTVLPASTEKRTLKRNKTKETIQKKPLPSQAHTFDEEARQIAGQIKSYVSSSHPYLRKKEKEISEEDLWAVERLHRIDGFDYKVIAAVVQWAHADDFWCAQIRSGAALRKHFDTLLVKIKSDQTQKKKRGGVIINDNYNARSTEDLRLTQRR